MIILKRSAALGDVFLIEPLLKALNIDNCVGIRTERRYQDLFLNHPALSEIFVNDDNYHCCDCYKGTLIPNIRCQADLPIEFIIQNTQEILETA